MLANLLQDVRYALHGFALRPMFAVVVVLTLAVGIGVRDGRRASIRPLRCGPSNFRTYSSI